ncbi:FecR domain-containing protein [Halalkalibaculum sp. DA3122]|uniref:FecR domain-containing protein n=1 Tax=Halalkalibaculum sp. DA3122 TaxID=3373607 RepID=UPI0037547D0F
MGSRININQLHRYLNGECSEEEKRHIEEWMRKDLENKQVVDELRRILSVQPEKELNSDTQMAWRKLANKIKESSREKTDKPANDDQRSEKKYVFQHSASRRTAASTKNKNYLKYFVRAAAVMLIALVGIYFFINPGALSTSDASKNVSMKEVVTKRAHEAELSFSDGTKVVLNAESKIRFPEQFQANTRKVFLEGEAYFEVAHLPDSPFIVQTNGAEVTVLGTQFNVKARPEESQISVAVADGKVSLASKSSSEETIGEEVILGANQMSVIKSGAAPIEPASVNIEKHLAWLRGDFAFDEEPFVNVLKEWERRFDVNFIVEDASLKSVKFSGEFRRESLNEMLQLTSQSLNFNYERQNNTIIIN